MSFQSHSRLAAVLPLAVSGFLLLTACASETGGLGGEEAGWAPPPGSEDAGAAGGDALPPPGLEGGDSGGLPAVATQGVPAEESGDEAADEESLVVKGPDGTNWALKRVEDKETYQADIEDCYRYAASQTRRDARIIDDRNAGIDTLTNTSRYSTLRQNVDEYDLRNRRASLMTGCMEAKGYTRTDTVLPRLVF